MGYSSIPIDWLPQYTYKDYEKWEGDWELIFGLPYSMSPSPKRAHQDFGRRFMRLVEDSFLQSSESCNCNIYYELDWIIDETTVVCPDVIIVCGKFEEDFLRFPPTLVLEITSENTRLKDRNVKFKLYEAQGVKYYIMADPEKNTIEVFQLKNNRYIEIASTHFQLTTTCIIELELQKLLQ
jgi:Uma2 family endonuclease